LKHGGVPFKMTWNLVEQPIHPETRRLFQHLLKHNFLQ
ncbi:MAG: hypothetical protein ACI92S_003872, partial [Planctomycetaceae bacterium]